jgi:hypothetical protein
MKFISHHGDTESTESFIKNSVNSVAPWLVYVQDSSEGDL